VIENICEQEERAMNPKRKKVFTPKIEIYTPFKKPFAKQNGRVVTVEAENAAACCACTACTACR
jgi:hypothetical protein